MAESIEIQRATGTGPKTTILRLKGPLTLATLFRLPDRRSAEWHH
jgi:hypothetical protein